VADTVTTLILPGIGNSGPEHWQGLWEAGNPGFIRVQQDDWDHPVYDRWRCRLEAAVAQAAAPVFLVAHSLGCLLAVKWAGQTSLTVRGALLVAPPDPASAVFPPQAAGFGLLPSAPLPFTSILVASSNDPYAGPDFSRRCAAAWGSRLVDAGPVGHINADSGLGSWPAGYALYRELIAAGDHSNCDVNSSTA
jgi:predicted alpha/beta hydrolase family esterase